MNIEQFISENEDEVDRGGNIIDLKTLESAEKAVSMKFGEELTEYLLKYGYLAYKHVELYGMNALQGLKSDMVKQTLYLHQYFPDTAGLVAIENQGEGSYFLVNSGDEIYAFDSSLKKLFRTNNTLFEYILKRFESVK